jgi:hypothetical protein
MSDDRAKSGAEKKADRPAEKQRKPYAKPSFRSEQVFETMALACGKMSPTELQCHGFQMKNS